MTEENAVEITMRYGFRREETATEHVNKGPQPPEDATSIDQFNSSLLEAEDLEQNHVNTTTIENPGNLPSSRGLLKYMTHLSESSRKEPVDFDFVNTLLSAGADINFTDRYDQTILHAVAKDWSTEVACFFLTKGASISQGDQYGRTPLHVAAIFNYPKMITCLVEAGADIEAESNEKQTPLHMAAKKDAVNSVAELLKLGAKLTARDGKGRTPLHVAANWGSPGAAKYLLNYGAPAGIHDHYGNLCVSSMVSKMPEVASNALKQFEYHDPVVRDAQYYLWTVDTTPTKFVSNSGAKSTLETVVLYNSLTVITAPVLQRLIQVKWKLFGFKYTMISVILNVIYTLIWTVLGFMTPRDGEFYFPVKKYIWRIVMEIILFIITVYFVVEQILRIRRKQKIFAAWKIEKVNTLESELQCAHPRYPEERRTLTNEIQRIKQMTKGNVFTDFWIILETFFIFMVVLVFSLRGAYEYAHEMFHDHGNAPTKKLKTAHDIFYALLLFTLWLRIMKEFRAFAFLASFITILGHVAKDTIKFAFLFMDIFIPYVVIFYMFFGGPENQMLIAKAGGGINYFNNILETCMTVWSVTLVADFPYKGIVAVNEYAAQFVVATYWAVSSLVCINLFIALMSETLSRVHSNAEASASLQLASWLGEIEASLSQKEKWKVKAFMKKRCNPFMSLGNQNNGEFDPQKIKLESLLTQIDQLNIRANQHRRYQENNSENMKLGILNVKHDIKNVCDQLQLVLKQQQEIDSLLTNSGFKQAGQMLKSLVGRVSSYSRPGFPSATYQNSSAWQMPKTILGEALSSPRPGFSNTINQRLTDRETEDLSNAKPVLRRTHSQPIESQQQSDSAGPSEPVTNPNFLRLPLWK